jgi:Family of unknown function (DUF5677)
MERVRQLTDVEPAHLREATDEITALIAEHLPLMFDADEDDWPPIAAGFLARAGQLLEALTALVERGHEGEAQMLLRIVYEHVTTFCWLAIDPKPHVLRWREWANSRQLKVHNGAKRFGITVLNPAEVAAYEKEQSPVSLPQLAKEVDRHWAQHSTAFRPYDDKKAHQLNVLTFSGFYTAVYRKTSNLIHADMASPDRFASMPLTGKIVITPSEQHTENPDYPSFAAVMVGFLLIVYGDRFGWPKREVVDRITHGLMYYGDDD